MVDEFRINAPPAKVAARAGERKRVKTKNNKGLQMEKLDISVFLIYTLL